MSGKGSNVIYNLPPPPHLHTPFPPFSPSLISLEVSVDVKHHVHLLLWVRMGGWLPSYVDQEYTVSLA